MKSYELPEISLKLIEKDLLYEKIQDGRIVYLRGKTKDVVIGEECLVKVNTSIGITRPSDYESEISKINSIVAQNSRPDIMMDLSICSNKLPIYEILVELHGGPVGTLPHYLLSNKIGLMTIDDILQSMEKQANAGVSFFTIHPTPNIQLLTLAEKLRKIPVTSRGASIMIRDMLNKKENDNLYSYYFNEVVRFCVDKKIPLSIGTAFRPPSVFNCLDSVHRAELQLQKQYIERARALGASVFFEAVGHASLDILQKLSKIIGSIKAPMMALGPIVSDSAIGLDHIANAIGGAFLAVHRGVHVLNSITREEHTGGIPTQDSIIEGLKSALLAAHCANIAIFPKYKKLEEGITQRRSDIRSCVINGGLFKVGKTKSYGCERCGDVCPILLNKVTE
ncbi:MAG: phosphomethylpyrimidine synthase ThiC [Candidatus Heimdallarchaeota archaeon]|nr:MAG: hypothetical protein DRP93_02710 [Candidatus Neomarinimicrobiota bacterium]